MITQYSITLRIWYETCSSRDLLPSTKTSYDRGKEANCNNPLYEDYLGRKYYIFSSSEITQFLLTLSLLNVAMLCEILVGDEWFKIQK